MSNLSRFLKDNKLKKENTKYAATKSLVDEKGQPLEWLIRPITTKMNDAIREDCMYEVPKKGKMGMSKEKLNTSKYISRLIVASVVEPDLNNKELQDSYGVMSAEELIKEMIDDPGEYNDFALFIQTYNGFTETLQDEVEEAKN